MYINACTNKALTYQVNLTCACRYGAFYLLWCLVCRPGWTTAVYGSEPSAQARGLIKAHRLSTCSGLTRRLGMDLLTVLLMLVLLFQIAWAWGVGVSRFRDNRHNVSDIVAGFMLALTFTPVFLARTIAVHSFWQGRMAPDECEQQQQMIVGGERNALPPV